MWSLNFLYRAARSWALVITVFHPGCTSVPHSSFESVRTRKLSHSGKKNPKRAAPKRPRMSLGSSSSWQQHFCCSDSSEELKSSWAQELLIKAEASGAFLRSQPEKGRGKHHHNLTIKKRQRHHQRLPKTHYTLLLPPSCSSFLLSRGCAVLPKAGGAFISRSSFWSSSPHLSGLRPFFSLGLCSGSSCSPPEQHSPAQAQLHSQGPFYRVRRFVLRIIEQ